MKYIILIISFILILGCSPQFETKVMIDTPQGAKEIISQQQTAEQLKHEEIITQQKELRDAINNAYNALDRLKKAKINCNLPEMFNVSLMNLTLKNWVDTVNNEQTAMWYPSIGEGRLGSLLLGDVRNLGCTKINPSYTIFVEYDQKIIHISEEDEFPPIGRLMEEWYPNDYTWGGSLPISGDIFNPLIVNEKGKYTIWVEIRNNNEIVGVEKIELVMGG